METPSRQQQPNTPRGSTKGSPSRQLKKLSTGVRRDLLVSFNSTSIGKLVQDFKTSNLTFNNLIGSCGINSSGACPRWCELQESSALENSHKTQLYNFRESLVNFIKTNICTQCVDYGSKNLTSNVDVTLNHVDIQVNINTLRQIQGFLTQLFDKVCMFQTSDEDGEKFVDLYKISRFFDLNFYLTNFALTLPNRGYAISNSYGTYSLAPPSPKQNRVPISQYVYAFHEVLYNLNLEGANIYSGIYKQTYDDLIAIITGDMSPSILKQDKPGYSNLVGKISFLIEQIKVITSQGSNIENKVNELYDHVSLLSTLEDECYHTQGSYFHVVLAMQAKQEVLLTLTPQMLCASAIENLCFAYSHRSKSNKYMFRVFDAIDRIKKIPLVEQLENNIMSAISSLQQPTQPSGEYGQYNLISKKILALLKLIFPGVGQEGAGLRLKKLVDKTGAQVRKLIKGRTRNVYVDSRRRQYVKFKNQYIRLTAISK
jgi:hypothetical protein